MLTNAHNLRRDEVTVSFADGRRETATVAGVDTDNDLAVLGGRHRRRAARRAGSRRDERPGIGAPVARARQPRRARPARHARLRLLRRAAASAARAAAASAGAIEHTAPLPRGSSGGPLVDPDGNLLGVNSLRLDGGLILAVPAGAAREGAGPRRWPAARRPRAHRLGVAVAPPRVARRLRRAVGLPERDGLLVRAVEDGSPGGAGRHRARRPDRRGRRQRDSTASTALYAALDGVPAAGGDLELTLVRGTDERTVTATFGSEQAA